MFDIQERLARGNYNSVSPEDAKWYQERMDGALAQWGRDTDDTAAYDRYLHQLGMDDKGIAEMNPNLKVRSFGAWRRQRHADEYAVGDARAKQFADFANDSSVWNSQRQPFQGLSLGGTPSAPAAVPPFTAGSPAPATAPTAAAPTANDTAIPPAPAEQSSQSSDPYQDWWNNLDQETRDAIKWNAKARGMSLDEYIDKIRDTEGENGFGWWFRDFMFGEPQGADPSKPYGIRFGSKPIPREKLKNIPLRNDQRKPSATPAYPTSAQRTKYSRGSYGM